MVKLPPNRRGLGYLHKQLRAAAIQELLDNESRGDPPPLCHFCGKPMSTNQKLHLDHNTERTGYRGLAHAGCNTRDGANKVNRSKKRRHSREW